MKVLLVDDEVELVSAMAERLGFRGVEADWTDSPEAALEMASKKDYDVAVLDMKMPKLSGLDLMGLLANKHPDLKYIFLSGHGSEADFKAGCAAGCNYLIKPIQLDELVSRLKEVAG